jgi:hypothetical protein
LTLVLGRFLDVTTMWKKPQTKRTADTALPDVKRSWWDKMRCFAKPKPIPGEVQHTTWHRRKIGILYSMQENYWVFLVLLAPGHKMDKPGEWKFCYRIIKDHEESHGLTNAYCAEGLRYYNGAQTSLQDAINWYCVNLRQKGGFRVLEQLFLDIFWGWEEYLTYVKSETMSVLL